MSLWSECCVAGAGGLCGKPVKHPISGMLGMCEEHRAHGTCCKCGRFWLQSGESGRVGDRDRIHTAFACTPAPEEP